MEQSERTHTLYLTPHGEQRVQGTPYASLEKARDAMREALRQPTVTTGGAGGTFLQERKRFLLEIVDEHGTVIDSKEGGETN
jgi:hypothetical protein